eukprot:13839761-Alexandrium_andersonii.AAC.1
MLHTRRPSGLTPAIGRWHPLPRDRTARSARSVSARRTARAGRASAAATRSTSIALIASETSVVRPTDAP